MHDLFAIGKFLLYVCLSHSVYLFGCIFSKTAERIQLKLCMELRSVLDAASRSLVVVTYEVPSPEPKFFFSLTVFLFGSHYFVFIH